MLAVGSFSLSVASSLAAFVYLMRAWREPIRLQDGDGSIRFAVQDDGVGFDVEGVVGSGLTNMRETTFSGSIPSS